MSEPIEDCTTELTAAERVQQDQNRADFMEFLYQADGRDDPEHPFAKTYTGLFQSYAYEIGRLTLVDLAESWHSFEITQVLEEVDGALRS